MYLKYFGIREKPFSITPDPRYLFLGEKHREALDHLIYGIHQGEGFMVITGDIGTGKTTLVRNLMERLEDQKTPSALILNPFLSPEELLLTILEDFGLQRKGQTKKALIDQLNTFLLDLNRRGKSAVLIVDEAQNLSDELLEELRILSNLETDKEKLLQIILVGQLELWDKLYQPKLRQLRQRISIRYAIGPLSLDETRRYIQHRLMVAGSYGELEFTPRAIRLVYEVSRGTPRLINLICDRALLAAYTDQEVVVTYAKVKRALESLRGGKPLKRRRSFAWKPLIRRMALVGAASMAVLGLILSLWFPPELNRMEPAVVSMDTPAVLDVGKPLDSPPKGFSS
jgi:general secretion pathway protein A